MSRFRFPSPLYPIVDPAGHPHRDHLSLAEAVLRGGAPFLQLRCKQLDSRAFLDCARAVQRLCVGFGAQLLINDRADIAALVGALGVHLGQEDVPPALIRPWLGSSAVIGCSTHNLSQARVAAQQGEVDYIAVGPIFPTASKENPDPVVGLDGLRRIRQAVALPIVAIGGITADTAAEVLAAGADAVAMIGAIAHSDDPAGTVRRLLEQLQP